MPSSAIIVFVILVAASSFICVSEANACTLVPAMSSSVGWMIQQAVPALPLHSKYVQHFIPALKEFQMPVQTHETRHNVLGLDAELNLIDADIKFNDLGSLSIKPIHWNDAEGILETGIVQLPDKDISIDASFDLNVQIAAYENTKSQAKQLYKEIRHEMQHFDEMVLFSGGPEPDSDTLGGWNIPIQLKLELKDVELDVGVDAVVQQCPDGSWWCSLKDTASTLTGLVTQGPMKQIIKRFHHINVENAKIQDLQVKSVDLNVQGNAATQKVITAAVNKYIDMLNRPTKVRRKVLGDLEKAIQMALNHSVEGLEDDFGTLVC